MSKIFCFIINLKFKNNISASKSLKNFYVNFYNSFYYYSIHCENNQTLNNYSSKIIDNLKINNFESVTKKCI